MDKQQLLSQELTEIIDELGMLIDTTDEGDMTKEQFFVEAQGIWRNIVDLREHHCYMARHPKEPKKGLILAETADFAIGSPMESHG